jgi:nucleoside permease NupC
LQQAIALFVLKTGAGFSMFNWIATLAADFLRQSHAGAAFFFDEASLHWFFVGVVRLLILEKIQSHSVYSTALCDHLLYCICADDVLPWCDAVGHWQIVCVFYFFAWHII